MKENKKQKDPAFLFYSSDWITGTQFFTFEQKGKYIELLCAQHDHGHLTEKQISIICKGDIDAEVMVKFTTDSEGKWYNIKLDNEILRRKQFSEYQSQNAKKRWDAKKDAIASAKIDAHVYVDTPRTVTETVTDTIALSKSTKSPSPDLKGPLDDLYSDLTLEELVTTNTQTLANHNYQAPWEPNK